MERTLGNGPIVGLVLEALVRTLLVRTSCRPMTCGPCSLRRRRALTLTGTRKRRRQRRSWSMRIWRPSSLVTTRKRRSIRTLGSPRSSRHRPKKSNPRASVNASAPSPWRTTPEMGGEHYANVFSIAELTVADNGFKRWLGHPAMFAIQPRSGMAYGLAWPVVGILFCLRFFHGAGEGHRPALRWWSSRAVSGEI
ncbi:hypothetical protein ACVWZM_002597 [Bradyrhizobium sp. USDA 4501]